MNSGRSTDNIYELWHTVPGEPERRIDQYPGQLDGAIRYFDGLMPHWRSNRTNFKLRLKGSEEDIEYWVLLKL